MGIVRFLLALAIISYHMGTPVLRGFLNSNTTIAAFFVISGFSVSYALSKKYPFSKPGLKTYYRNRFLRIYPLYFIALIGTLVIQVFIYQTYEASSLATALTQLEMGNPLQTAHYVFENLTLCNLWHAWTVAPATIPLIVLPAWTLLVEFWFYLLAPFLNRLSSKWVVGLLCVSMAVRYATFHHLFGLNAYPDNQFFPNQLVYFLIGMLSYRFSGLFTVKKYFSKAIILAMLCYLIVFGNFISVSGITHWLFLGVLSLSLPSIQPFDYQYFIIKRLGEFSYPLFLFHLPVVWLGLTYVPQPVTSSAFWYLAVSVICAVFYLFVRPLITATARSEVLQTEAR